jgi:hypothetical protein
LGRYYFSSQRKEGGSGAEEEHSFNSKLLLKRWQQSENDIAVLKSFINYIETRIYGQPEKVRFASQ